MRPPSTYILSQWSIGPRITCSLSFEIVHVVFFHPPNLVVWTMCFVILRKLQLSQIKENQFRQIQPWSMLYDVIKWQTRLLYACVPPPTTNPLPYMYNFMVCSVNNNSSWSLLVPGFLFVNILHFHYVRYGVCYTCWLCESIICTANPIRQTKLQKKTH